MNDLMKIRLFIMIISGLLISGCASVEPWVKPYERAHLADPIMNFQRNPVSSSYMTHVYQAREGARGAEGGGGSGCGCN